MGWSNKAPMTPRKALAPWKHVFRGRRKWLKGERWHRYHILSARSEKSKLVLEFWDNKSFWKENSEPKVRLSYKVTFMICPSAKFSLVFYALTVFVASFGSKPPKKIQRTLSEILAALTSEAIKDVAFKWPRSFFHLSILQVFQFFS